MDLQNKKCKRTIITMFKNVLLSIILVFSLSTCKNKPHLQSYKNKVVIKEGKLVYEKYCLACHQTNGAGVPGMYPPLGNSDRVVGNKDSLIHVVLCGLTGEIEINGDVYNNEMPAHNYLSDEQIADVLTYIRSEFSNNAGSVSTEEVKKLRDKAN